MPTGTMTAAIAWLVESAPPRTKPRSASPRKNSMTKRADAVGRSGRRASTVPARGAAAEQPGQEARSWRG